jgi:hypothetical protein
LSNGGENLSATLALRVLPASGLAGSDQGAMCGGGPGNKVGEFARLFMIPRVDHCGGGTDAQGNVQPEMFDALVSWVEKG